MAAHGLATPAQQHTFDINTGLDAVIGRKQAGRIAGFTRRQRELHTQLLRAHSLDEIEAYSQQLDEYQQQRLAELKSQRQGRKAPRSEKQKAKDAAATADMDARRKAGGFESTHFANAEAEARFQELRRKAFEKGGE